jgi:hypothetical protein
MTGNHLLKESLKKEADTMLPTFQGLFTHHLSLMTPRIRGKNNYNKRGETGGGDVCRGKIKKQ